MLISISTKSNGIHDYASIVISEPEIKDLKLMKEIIEIVQIYNESNAEKA